MQRNRRRWPVRVQERAHVPPPLSLDALFVPESTDGLEVRLENVLQRGVRATRIRLQVYRKGRIDAATQRQKAGTFTIRFYEDETSLCRIVSGFVAEGLHAGQPGLVIAGSAAHNECILDNLRAAGININTLAS